MFYLYFLLGPVYIFLRIQDSDDYSQNVIPLVILYLVLDVIMAFVAYASVFGASIMLVLVGVVVRSILFYFIAKLNIGLRNPILSTIIYFVAFYIINLALSALFIPSYY